MYDRLRAGTFALLWRKAEDAQSVLRIVEVVEVGEPREFVGWFYVHAGRALRGQYDHEKPLIERRLIPEWRNKRTGAAEQNPSEVTKRSCMRVMQTFDESNYELVAAGFPLHSGGKVPESVCKAADAWLRARAKVEPRALKSLSYPTDRELNARARMK